MVKIERSKIGKYDWEINVFQQHCGPPFLPYCAIAERSEPGKRWVINAEGKTSEEAIHNLQVRIKESKFNQ
ncbi:MAG: hypothetical protein M0R50_06015 [Candidatus Cloacimonetes bacterium]|jgi:hypothetical protein|nr:hypothetical protein [Candidatus Cloacimonadota bacterium]